MEYSGPIRGNVFAAPERRRAEGVRLSFCGATCCSDASRINPAVASDQAPGRHHLEDRVEGRLNGIEPLEGELAVEDLLQNLGVGDEPLARPDAGFKKTSRRILERVPRANQVHPPVGGAPQGDPAGPGGTASISIGIARRNARSPSRLPLYFPRRTITRW